MAKSIRTFLSYLIIIAFLSTSTNLSYLSQRPFPGISHTLRTQSAAISLPVSLIKSELQSPAEGLSSKASSSGSSSREVTEVMLQSFMENHTVKSIIEALAKVELKDLPAVYKSMSDNYKQELLHEIGREGLIALFERLEEQANDMFKDDNEDKAIDLYKSVIFFAKAAGALIVHDNEFEWIGKISLLGGKIDNSLMLSKGELEVPPFFGITSMFQKYIWLYNNILPKMREIAFSVDTQNNSAASSPESMFAQLINDTYIPEDLKSKLMVEARKLADREGYALTEEEADKLQTEVIEIIFRSSQGLEDRPGIPSAGIGSSIPTVGTDNMPGVFKDVAASAYLERALGYRDKIAISTWLLSRMTLNELKHIVQKLKDLAEITPKVEIGGIFCNTLDIVNDLEANLSKEMRSRQEFVNVSTLRVLTLLELLHKQSAKDAIMDKALAEIKDVRIECLDAARIGGGIQTQTMRSSEYSIVGFAVNKATGWTGYSNDMIVVDYDISRGRGELVVQGNIISDHYKILINPKNGKAMILSKECGTKLATLKRAEPGTEIDVWPDTKYESMEKVIAEKGREYLTVTPVEKRQQFVVSDKKAIEIAFKILRTNEVHNEGRPQPVPVDMEACYFYNTKGEIEYSIVQKRDSAIKPGFDFEDPDFVTYAGTEPVSGLADAAQEQGHMKAKGFGTQNAACGVTVWVEEPSEDRIEEAITEIWLEKDENALNAFIPRAHPDLYSADEKSSIVEKIRKNKKIADTGIQDDFDIEEFDFGKARILERVISRGLSLEDTLEELNSAFLNDFGRPEKDSLVRGIKKLFSSTGNTEERMKVVSIIIRANILSSTKIDMKKIFVKEESEKLTKDVLSRQFNKIRSLLDKKVKVIMVTPETNPNFNDIMKLVDEKGGATVTLQGGRSAHAIIISIQFGYCVVGGAEFNDSELLEKIKNGEQVLLTVDGNKGQIYDIEIPITRFFVSFEPGRWGNYGGDIGLITNSIIEVEKAAKIAQWQVPVDEKMYPYMKGKESVGYYSVSLDRVEEILIELGLDFRGAFAYDRLMAIRAEELDEENLSESQKSDIAALRGRRDLIEKVTKKINDKGFKSAVGYLRHSLADHFRQMLATTRPGQVIQVRERDFKLREIVKTQDTAELFYNEEEASMIGFRGIALEVDDENIEALDLQFLALEDARVDAEELGGLGDLGFMFVFVRRILDDPEHNIESDFKKGLNRLLKLRREGRIKRIPKQVGVMFELVINALLAEELAKVLADFREQVKEEFGEEIETYFSNGTNDQTQSVKGSRDEGRYVSMDVLMPDNTIIKGIKVFYEGDPAVGDTIEHGARIAKKYGHKRGSCGEYFNNLIGAGDAKSIESARSGFGRLDSAGTSIKFAPKAVKLLADSQLAKQRIPTNVTVKAKVVARGESLFGKGAAHRRAVFIRSEGDFTTSRVVLRDGAKNKETRYAPKTAEGDVLILSTGIKAESGKLLETLESKASGAVLTGEGANIDALKKFLKERNIPTIVIEKDIFGRIEDLKQYVFDFERGAIYTEKNISFALQETENRTAYAHIDFTAKPEEISVKTVDMDDIYNRIGMHPLALVLYALHKGEIGNPVVEIGEGGQKITRLDKILSQQRVPLEKNRFPEVYEDVEALLQEYGVTTVSELINKLTKQAIAEARKDLPKDTILAFGTSQQDAWAFEKLKWGKREQELECKVSNVPIDLRGLAKTISAGYGYAFKMFLKAVKEEGLDVQFNYVQDLNILDAGIEFIKQCGLDPNKNGFKLGMSASTSHNFIVAYRYFNREAISFVNFNDEHLIMNFALANLDHHTYVRQWNGENRPLINTEERSFQVALARAKAMLRTAMVNHGVKEVASVKESDILTEAESETTAQVQTAINRLLDSRREGDIQEMPEWAGVILASSASRDLTDKLESVLAHFRNYVQAEFGETTKTYVQEARSELIPAVTDGRDEQISNTGILRLHYDKSGEAKASSSGNADSKKIFGEDTDAEYIKSEFKDMLDEKLELMRKGSLEDALKRKASVTIPLLSKNGSLINTINKMLDEFRDRVRKEFDIGIESSFSSRDGDITFSVGGRTDRRRDERASYYQGSSAGTKVPASGVPIKLAKKDYKAEVNDQNTYTITYAVKSKLTEDKRPRMLILPSTNTIAEQVSLAMHEIDAIKENLGVIIVRSNNPLGVIDGIKKGRITFEYKGDEMTILQKNISVILNKSQLAGLSVSEVNNALGANNTLVMNDIKSSQYVPFSQLAMLAKTHLILNEIGISSDEAGPYRSAFLAIWKSLTGSALPGTIAELIKDPAACIISILIMPESVLGKTEMEALHNRAAKIWA